MTSGKPARRVLVVSGGNQVYDYISELLPHDEFDPITHVTDAGEAKRLLLSSEYDILIINTPLSDEFGTELALNYADSPLGILLLCKSDLFEQVCYKVEDSGILTISKPVNRNLFYGAIKLLTAVGAKLGRLEKTNQSLKEKMADIRVVNRAKWLLIEHLGMNEKDAHYYIEKQAMNTRLSRRETAEQIIRTYDQ
ncbi:MAG: ANTAR domain-containing protein [Firmicutes bacterium]|nr:ANTAR domain-containing protein [Bacillota bacterium]